jgi:hypothetical protein
MEQINSKNNKRKIFFRFNTNFGSIIISGAVSAASLANSAQPKI